MFARARLLFLASLMLATVRLEQGAMKDVKLSSLDSSLGEHMEFYARQAQANFAK